jgi:hypothetical protein
LENLSAVTDPLILTQKLNTWVQTAATIANSNYKEQLAYKSNWEQSLAEATATGNSYGMSLATSSIASYTTSAARYLEDYNTLSAMKFAKGGAFTNGIVSDPTTFNMGLMGEAGPEAIMPLTRMADGSLGVAYAGQQTNADLIEEIRALREQVATLTNHAAANVRMTQAVGKAQIEQLEDIAHSAAASAQTNRLMELKS